MDLKKLKGNKDALLIIAEVGSNHEGSVVNAKDAISYAADAGADVVKFQSLDISKLYFNPTPDLVKLHELIDFNEEWYHQLKMHADNAGIIFSSSPTYLESVKILSALDIGLFKVASAQVSTFPMLLAEVAATMKPAILSTGISTYSEITRAVNIFEEEGNTNYAILHCNSQYPTSPEKVYLGRMETYKKMFNCAVGFSDHTLGTAVTLAAVAMGADIIEKHFKIDEFCTSPDASISLTKSEFKRMVDEIKEVKAACTDKPRIALEQEEAEFLRRVGYKLVLNSPKSQGDKFSKDDFLYLRCEDGISVGNFELIKENFRAAEMIPAKTLLGWHHLKSN
jgi:sialic acid synthase SpsE